MNRISTLLLMGFLASIAIGIILSMIFRVPEIFWPFFGTAGVFFMLSLMIFIWDMRFEY